MQGIFLFDKDRSMINHICLVGKGKEFLKYGYLYIIHNSEIKTYQIYFAACEAKYELEKEIQ